MRLKLARYLLCVPFIGSASFAASDAYQARLVTESLLLDIAESNQTLYAVGERGHIIESQDGATWQQHAVPSKATLTAINFQAGKGWAVGHDATILHVADNQTWEIQLQKPELERPFLDVLFFDADHGIAIGAYGLFYRTTNGGQDWAEELHAELLHPDDQEYLEEIREEDEAFYQEELASILPHLNRVTLVGEMLYLAGESGLLARSEDLGQSWSRMDVNYAGSFFDINQAHDGNMLAAGLRGNIFSYDEQSQQWKPLQSHSQASLNTIVPLENSSLIVGNNGSLLCVSDYRVNASQDEDKQAISAAVVFNQTLVAVTAEGIKTFDYQADKCVGTP